VAIVVKTANVSKLRFGLDFTTERV